MCTLTAINLKNAGCGTGYRVVVNRDEQRTRSQSQAPSWHKLNESRAVWPVDPDSGGTWIAVSESGLTLAIVNSHLEPMPNLPADLISRGGIIPELIESQGIEEVVDRLSEMPIERFAPFRLLAVDLAADEEGRVSPRMLVLDWDRVELAVETHLDGPVCLVSSGLGDSAVEPRLGLFAEMMPLAELSVAAQDAFHAHRWADRPEISVMMSRDSAWTESVTVVECCVEDEEPVRMAYREITQ